MNLLKTSSDWIRRIRQALAINDDRVAIAIPLVFMLVSCGVSQPRSGVSSEIFVSNGAERLTIVNVPTGDFVSNGVPLEFHSLIWRSKSATGWTERAVITKASFNAGAPAERWVTGIHAFDPLSANAIIKVGELSVPRTNEATIATSVIYSWRVWNILSNKQVMFLQICKDPVEAFKAESTEVFRNVNHGSHISK